MNGWRIAFQHIFSTVADLPVLAAEQQQSRQRVTSTAFANSGEDRILKPYFSKPQWLKPLRRNGLSP